MPWSSVGGRCYYYRSLWLDGRPVRRYVGTGPVAELAAAHDDLRRVEKEAGRRALRAERERWAAALEPLARLCRLSDLILKLALTGAGFHQHARRWRKRRVHHHPEGGAGRAGGRGRDP
jgi:hypothetical protein